jgi:hypothetical protein
MKCVKVRLNLGAFVLDGLEPEETAEIRHHLTLCSGCRNELKELEKISKALEAAPPSVDPPGYLKDEVLSRARAEEPAPSNEKLSSSKSLPFIIPGAAAAALVVIVALGIFFGSKVEPPVATVQLLPTDENEEYWGVAELHPQPLGNQLVELKLNNLDEPGPDSFYEMWFVSGERHISAGTFTTTGSGETKVWLTVPPKTRNYRTLLITEEHAAGDPSEEAVLRGEVP